MNRPAFITFTGVDAFTSLPGMRELAAQYPVEFGVLFSPSRQGKDNRYPPVSAVMELTRSVGMPLSAHLCGADARAVIESGRSQWDGLLKHHFSRAQINTSNPAVDPIAIGAWAARVMLRAILQCRGALPVGDEVDYLFDASGGRGIVPTAWPAGVDGQLCGYAGGLNPDNVAGLVARIAPHAGSYWLDMETGVRDENDRFDLSKCRAVCEAVYGN